MNEYTYYQTQYEQKQTESDALNALLGFPRVDLAHAKVIERQLLKSNRPDWKQLKEQLSFEVACSNYLNATLGA